MRCRLGLLAPALAAIPWLSAAACGPPSPPAPAAPLAIELPVASASAASASASAPKPEEPGLVAVVDAGADDPLAMRGNMWGDSIGDAAGDGGAAGFGRLGGGKYEQPSLRQGATQVNGKMPPAVIQRIVRMNFGRFRLCYENGLRTKPDLQGRIAIKFVIDPSGAVTSTADGGSDLPDASVISCVGKGFAGLSFPKPEGGGSVTVVYPIIFNPGDPIDAAKPAKPPAKKK